MGRGVGRGAGVTPALGLGCGVGRGAGVTPGLGLGRGVGRGVRIATAATSARGLAAARGVDIVAMLCFGRDNSGDAWANSRECSVEQSRSRADVTVPTLMKVMIGMGDKALRTSEADAATGQRHTILNESAHAERSTIIRSLEQGIFFATGNRLLPSKPTCTYSPKTDTGQVPQHCSAFLTETSDWEIYSLDQASDLTADQNTATVFQKAESASDGQIGLRYLARQMLR